MSYACLRCVSQLVFALGILPLCASSHAQAVLHDRDPGGRASPAVPAASIVEVQWNLTELHGSPIRAVDPPATHPYIYLQAQGDRLSGSAGCNRIFGSYDLSGSSLQFHSVASTRMACGGNSTAHESELLDALKLTTGFWVAGDVLELRVDERVVARFVAEKKSNGSER